MARHLRAGNAPNVANRCRPSEIIPVGESRKLAVLTREDAGAAGRLEAEPKAADASEELGEGEAWRVVARTAGRVAGRHPVDWSPS